MPPEPGNRSLRRCRVRRRLCSPRLGEASRVFVHRGDRRGALGVRAHGIYRGVEDPNDITVWHDFDDRATAESFMGSDDLREAMTRAGVVSAPNLWLTNEA